MKQFVIQQCHRWTFTGWAPYHTMPAGTTREAAEIERERLANIFPGHTFRVAP